MSTLTTIAGWVGANPALTEGRNGTKYTTVRVATTDRYRNAEKEWVDGPTQWFAVRLFGDFAENAAGSVRRGDPVVVTGRFVLDNWETEERSGSSLVLYASAMGHDLSRGRSLFTRVVRSGEGARDGNAGSGTDGAEPDSDDPGAPSDSAGLDREPDPFETIVQTDELPAEPVSA